MAIKVGAFVWRMPFTAVLACFFFSAMGQAPYLEFSASRVWVKDVDEEVLHTFKRYHNRQRDWQEVFPVSMTGGNRIQGEYEVSKNVVSFTPRFPFSRGTEYTATFYLNDLTENYNEIYLQKTNSETLTFQFSVPAYQHSEPKVIGVYPSADILPENQLKFHIAFNSSMTSDEMYKRVKLFNNKGKLMEKAFLILDQELWDNEMKVATILMDPGRIKRGLRPNVEMGTALKKNEKYTLVIEAGWKDVNGNPTTEMFKKEFSVTGADRTIVDYQSWELLSPVTASAPMIIEFKEYLDYVMLPESFIILDSRGHKINGKFQLLNNESTVAFTPDADWKTGDYVLYINPLLEDAAGNNLNRLFDEDISDKHIREERTIVSKEFSIQLLQN
jgi:hypothetical protein